MENKLEKIMKNWDLNVFELINLAIQVARHLYPAELALRRDRIIERLYNNPDVMRQNAARASDKKAPVSTKGGVGSSKLITGQGQASKQKRSNDAKGELQLSQKKTCARNYTLKIVETEPRPVPVGTRQGQLSAAAKGKEKILYTESVPRHTDGTNIRNNQGQSSAAAKGKEKIPYTKSVPRHTNGTNIRNNQVRSNDLKGKGIAPPAEKVQKHGGINFNKTLTIGGGEVAQKINTSSGGCQGSSQHDNCDEQDITIINDLIKISKGKEKAEDPLDMWNSSCSDDA